MAKVTVTFEDIEDGVEVKIASEPVFTSFDITPETFALLSMAQQMGIELTTQVNEKYSQDHIHDENCIHEHADSKSEGQTPVQSHE